MILYDDLEPSEKVKVYDKGVTVSQSPEEVYEMLVSYRSGDMWAPRLDTTEALQTEALHFIDCIENNKRPKLTGRRAATGAHRGGRGKIAARARAVGGIDKD